MFHAISNITKKMCVKKNPGGDVEKFILRKTILSHFTFYAIFNIKKIYIEKCPFTYWFNGRWFLQIVDRDSWNLYRDSWNLYPLYPLFPCSDFVSQMWWGGGGVWEYNFFFWRKTIISHLMFSLCFFLCWKYWKVPLHLQLLVKWEVVSPNSRHIGNSTMDT